MKKYAIQGPKGKTNLFLKLTFIPNKGYEWTCVKKENADLYEWEVVSQICEMIGFPESKIKLMKNEPDQPEINYNLFSWQNQKKIENNENEESFEFYKQQKYS